MYSEKSKETMKGIAEITPAFSDFEHEVLDALAVVACNLKMLRMPEYETHTETLVQHGLVGVNEAISLFRELHR